MHGSPRFVPFNFPNGNLKQQLSHMGVFISFQNIDAKNNLNLRICGVHLLNPYKTVVSHLNCILSWGGKHESWQNDRVLIGICPNFVKNIESMPILHLLL